MKMIRKSTEAEMVWAFLNMEYKSSRFHEKLDKIIKEREIDKSIIGDEFFLWPGPMLSESNCYQSIEDILTAGCLKTILRIFNGSL